MRVEFGRRWILIEDVDLSDEEPNDELPVFVTDLQVTSISGDSFRHPPIRLSIDDVVVCAAYFGEVVLEVRSSDLWTQPREEVDMSIFGMDDCHASRGAVDVSERRVEASPSGSRPCSHGFAVQDHADGVARTARIK